LLQLNYLCQAFESVIPSECTKVTIKVTDGSVVAQVQDNPGALVVHMGETAFSTDIVGDAPESIFNISVPDLSILFIDDYQTGLQVKESDHMKPMEVQGAAHWKVSSFMSETPRN
jgi:autophagy-related protein 2